MLTPTRFTSRPLLPDVLALVLIPLLASPQVSAFADERGEPTPACSAEDVAAHADSAARCAFRAEIERLKLIQRRHEDHLLRIKGVVGMGIGKAAHGRRPVFVILVEQGSPRPRLPRRIEGVEVRVEPRAPVGVLDGGACAPCHREQFPPPVRMGNSGGLIAINGGCTLGFKACDLGTGRMVFVTNSHCNVVIPAPTCGLATPGGIVDAWSHPGLFEQMGTPYEIGNVAGHAAPSCGANNNLTDATKVTSPSTLTSLAVRDVPFYPSITPGDPMPGDAVQKSGRTSGLTLGEVTTINTTVAVAAGAAYCCGALTMKQQVEWLSDPATGPGDSGSALLSTEEPPRVVGLHWGSDGTYAYANHIGNVLSALNIALNPTACLADCIYGRAARTLPPPDTAAAPPIQTPGGLIELGHRYRDQVLRRSPVGQQFMAYFNQFSDEGIALAERSPGLLGRTAQALVTVAPSVLAVVESGEATVPAAHLEVVDTMLTAYADGASDELQAAIRDTRERLRSPKVLRALGIRVEGRHER
jgi:hypothetical protein